MSASGNTGKPTVCFFVSYARKDAKLAEQLLVDLRREFANSAEFDFKEWRDTKNLRSTENFHPEILAGIEACDFGLQLVSLDFLTRPYIRGHETPRFESGSIWPTAPAQRLGIPIALTDLDHSIHDLGPFAHQTPFRFQSFGGVGYAFEDCAPGSTRRRRFVRACFVEILQTLRKYRPWTPTPPREDNEGANGEAVGVSTDVVPSSDSVERDEDFFPLFSPGVADKLRDTEFFLHAISEFYSEAASDYGCSVEISERRLREAYHAWMQACETEDAKQSGARENYFFHASQIAAQLLRFIPINNVWFTRDVAAAGDGVDDIDPTEVQIRFAQYGNELCALFVGFYICLTYELIAAKERLQRREASDISEVFGIKRLPRHFSREFPALIKAEGASQVAFYLLYRSLFVALEWEVQPQRHTRGPPMEGENVKAVGPSDPAVGTESDRS